MSNKQLTKIFDNFVKSFVATQHIHCTVVERSRQFREKKKEEEEERKEKRRKEVNYC